MRTREEQIKPWGYISPFAKKGLQDHARCDLTITRKSTVSETMALYTDEQLREAERRAEQRVREEIGRDSERLDWLDELGEKWGVVCFPCAKKDKDGIQFPNIRSGIDAARESK